MYKKKNENSSVGLSESRASNIYLIEINVVGIKRYDPIFFWKKIWPLRNSCHFVPRQKLEENKIGSSATRPFARSLWQKRTLTGCMTAFLPRI